MYYQKTETDKGFIFSECTFKLSAGIFKMTTSSLFSTVSVKLLHQ